MFTERGDHVLVEEYTYPTFVETALPLGLRITGVPMDEYGLRPDSLDNTLQSWNEAEEGKRPRIIYVIPTGQNPTGTTASLTRRRELYRIAQRWNLYILEDDPYYFVQFNGRGKENTSSPHQLVESLVPSYLNIDTDGRVFRMDTVSKVIAPGLRMGWVTASEQVIQRLVWAQETSVQNPSGLSQIVMLRLLQRWSQEGFGQWVWNLQSFYLTKRDTMKDVIDRFLPAEIVSYVLPQAGFYVGISLGRVSSLRVLY